MDTTSRGPSKEAHIWGGLCLAVNCDRLIMVLNNSDSRQSYQFPGLKLENSLYYEYHSNDNCKGTTQNTRSNLENFGS